MRDELRVDPRLAHAARDQLRVLPAEVDHQHRPLLGERLRPQWTTLAAAVVRRVLGDRDVVRMRLAQPRAGDADEARVLHRLDRRGAAVAHRLAEAADDLVDDAAQRPL